MDQKIIDVFKSYDISELEIKDIKNIAPMIEVLSSEEFNKNCLLLTNYGYPKSDLDFLFLANPNIFVRSAKDLEYDLQNLKAKYSDIEIILKQDPLII